MVCWCVFCVSLGLDSGFDTGPVIVLIAVGCVCLVDCVCVVVVRLLMVSRIYCSLMVMMVLIAVGYVCLVDCVCVVVI